MADLTQFAGFFGIALPILIIILIWSLIWKGIALWKAARKNSIMWFVILLIVNTLGILEILYIFLLSEMKISEHSQNFKFKRNSEVSKISLEEKKKKRK